MYLRCSVAFTPTPIRQATLTVRPSFAHLHRQRIQLQEGVMRAAQWPAAEGFHLGVSARGHLRHLALGQFGDSELLGQLLHPPRRHAQQVAGGHNRDQGLLGAAAMLQQ
jgi:hypothetical protein